MEPLDEEPKMSKVRRSVSIGPNFDAVAVFENKPVESGITVAGRSAPQQPSVKLHISSRLLPLSILPAPSGLENTVPEIDKSLNIINTMPMKREIICCHYTEDFEYIVVGSIDGTVRLYKSGIAKDFLVTFTDEEISNTRASVTSINYRPINNGHPRTNSIICTYINGLVKCWNYMYSECLYSIVEKGQTYGLVYHVREPKFITFGEANKLLLYDEETRVLERVFYTKVSRQQQSQSDDIHITAGCFHPRSDNIVLAAGRNDEINFWDVRMPSSFRKITGPRIARNGLEVLPRRNEILTCSWRNNEQIQLWDFLSGKLISTIETDDQSHLYCGKYFAHNFIATGGINPNVFRIIDMRTSKTLGKIKNLSGGVYSLDIGWSNDNRKSSISPRILFCSGKKLYEIDILDYELSL